MPHARDESKYGTGLEEGLEPLRPLEIGAASTVDDLVRYIDLEPRQTQSMSEVTLRTSLLLFLLILVLLSAEWIIRKRSGMI